MHRRAFSLLELVIVMVIIGIIAAIAVPRISAAAAGSSETALIADLSVLRRAIEHYAAEHAQVFPGANPDGMGGSANSAEAFVSQLTLFSAADGRASATKTSDHVFGPYVSRIPELPVGANHGSASVAIDSSNSPPLVTGNGEGWVYNPVTGEIIANSDEANRAGTRAYDEY